MHWSLALAVCRRLGHPGDSKGTGFKLSRLVRVCTVLLVVLTTRLLVGLRRHAARALRESFVRGPGARCSATLRAMRRREPVHHAGHNPLGALMVVALLAAAGS
jgi:cytochrome b